MNRDLFFKNRLVIVSNRLPFTARVTDGNLVFAESTGGLVTGLASYLDGVGKDPDLPSEYVWVGWPGSTVPESLQGELRAKALQDHHSVPVFLTAEEMDQFYFGFCNRTVWPLFHYFPSITEFREEFWQQYVRVNQLFCDTLAEVVREDDVVWVHDYHLMLLPAMLKERTPSVPVGFFLHIPFPSFEVFRLLPGRWRRDLLHGMLGADLVGFHTYDYTQHFLQSVVRLLGHDNHLGTISSAQRVTKVETFPMGVDFAQFSRAVDHEDVIRERERLRGALEKKRAIVSVDRLDYTKGILNRLQGFESLLEAHPEYHGNVVLLMVVVPSRVMVDQYEALKKQIEEYVGKINGRFGSVGWTPIVYQYRYLSFHPLVALYAVSDVALITPLRDGMNLVAKEYVATRAKEDGVLILSEMVGAAKELGEAIIINPSNHEEIATALHDALEMSPEEQQRHMRIMRGRLQRYTVRRWAIDFVGTLSQTRTTQESYLAKLLTPASRPLMFEQYSKASKRIFLIDYDGTLVSFARRPWLATPTKEVLAVLTDLATVEGNTVVVVSGRDREPLEQWLGGLPVHLIAEHGMWLRDRGGEWALLKQLDGSWKGQIRPILELYADRLPGSFVEEKDFSLAWHYRVADPEQSAGLVGEVKDHLVTYTANIDLQVLHGSKVIEVRNSGVNKGVAARRWLDRGAFDFIFAAGDDWTDEDLFAALPETAWSLKVGIASTRARFNVRDIREILRLLESLAAARVG